MLPSAAPVVPQRRPGRRADADRAGGYAFRSRGGERRDGRSAEQCGSGPTAPAAQPRVGAAPIRVGTVPTIRLKYGAEQT
ncbi:hypothetical protein NI25_25450 [Streptomyces sp. CCM_MD2014]|nr:hypothetical protein NI25_25450 [Streptomyces sp. CCM_MD2014]